MSFSLLLMKHDISQNYVQVLKYVDFQTKVIKGSSISQTEWLWILLMNNEYNQIETKSSEGMKGQPYPAMNLGNKNPGI